MVTKRLISLPRFFILHLKRFQSKSGKGLKKISDKITPLKTLELSKSEFSFTLKNNINIPLSIEQYCTPHFSSPVWPVKHNLPKLLGKKRAPISSGDPVHKRFKSFNLDNYQLESHRNVNELTEEEQIVLAIQKSMAGDFESVPEVVPPAERPKNLVSTLAVPQGNLWCEVSGILPVYQLHAVVHHKGSLDFGHYVCDVFNSLKNNWARCDDSQVNPISDKDFIENAKNGYLYFYIHTNLLLK